MAMSLHASIEPLTAEELLASNRDSHHLFADSANTANMDQTTMAISLQMQRTVITAQLPGISSSHRAAATNALCALIEQCQASESFNIRSLIQINELLTLIFDVFLQWSQAAKGKSMRQFISTLGNSLKTIPDARREKPVTEAVCSLFDIVFKERNALQVKPALQTLELFLSKDVVSLPSLLHAFHDWYIPEIGQSSEPQDEASVTEQFIFACLQWLSNADKASAAAHLVCIVVKKISNIAKRGGSPGDAKNKMPVWVRPVTAIVRRDRAVIPALQNYVFPIFFKHNPEDTIAFLNFLQVGDHLGLDRVPQDGSFVPNHDGNTGINNELEMSLLFAALSTAKELGLIQEIDSRSSFHIEIKNGCILIPDSCFGKLMSDVSSSKRLTGLSLLVSSASITRPFTAEALKYLRKEIPNFHVDPDTNLRSQMLSLTQKLFDRLRAATSALKRQCVCKLPQDYRLGQNFRKNGDKTGSGSCSLQTHFGFIQWYRKFIIEELRPTAPYQRRICSLKALLVLLKSGLDSSVSLEYLTKQAQRQNKWPFEVRLIDKSTVELLLNLLMDPYDDIRSSAAAILSLAMDNFHEQEQCLGLEDLRQFVAQAEYLMLKSGRADHADGVARSYALLINHPDISGIPMSTKSPDKSLTDTFGSTQVLEGLVNLLQKSLAAARIDLANAVDSHPMHGTLASLRYIIDQAPSRVHARGHAQNPQQPTTPLFHRIVACLEGVWTCVRNVLCNDAPEGHMPGDMDEADLDTKSVLSFCWRALREASLLLQTLIDRGSLGSEGSLYLESQGNLLELGNLCFEQLVELRHRGAFSTVAQAFAACCARCNQSGDPVIQGYLDVWCKRALVAIRDQATIVTRRSAGIPSLIVGILSADPSAVRFSETIKELEFEARVTVTKPYANEGGLSQVHALNCLKDIFRAAKLGQSSERYIELGFDLVGHCLDAEIWAIRNCGLMLFRALTDRLLGTNESQVPDEPVVASNSRISFQKHPKLFDLVIKFLRAGHASLVTSNINPLEEQEQSTAEAVFPVLYVLQKALPPNKDIDEIRNLVLSLTASSEWVIRDMASRTFAALVAHIDATGIIEQILDPLLINQNVLHGRLLAAKYIIHTRLDFARIESRCKDNLVLLGKASPSGASEVGSLFEIIKALFPSMYQQNLCPITKAAFVDIVSLFAPVQDVTYLSEHFVNDLDRTHPTDLTGLLRRSVEHLVQIQVHSLTGTNVPTVTHENERQLSTALQSDQDQTKFSSEFRNCFLPRMHWAESEYIEERLPSFTNASQRSDLLRAPSKLRFPTHTASRSAPHSEINKSQVGVGLLDKYITDPSSEELVLSLYGVYLNAELSNISTGQSEEQLQASSYRLHNAVDDYKPSFIRSAVAETIWLFRPSWFSPSHSMFKLDMHLLLQKVLNDDEQEIRTLGAASVAHILASEKTLGSNDHKVPPIAAKQHCDFLIRTYARTEEGTSLLVYLVTKLTGGDTHTTLSSLGLENAPIESILYQFFARRIALFDEEDQNLYRDQTSECAIWARMIEDLAPTLWHKKQISENLVQHLSKWVMEGLSILAHLLRNGISDSDIAFAGCLGWTYDKHAFALAYSVIRAAKLLIIWRQEFRIGPVKASSIKRALFKFLLVAEENNANPHLVQLAKKVIGDGCRLTFKVLNRKVEQVLGKRLIGLEQH